MFKRIGLLLVMSIFLFNVGHTIDTGMDLDDLIDEIRRLAVDTRTDPTQQKWSSSTITDRINMAHMDIVMRARCLQQTSWIDTVDNQEGYLLDDSILVIHRVAYTTKGSSETVLSSSDTYRWIVRSTMMGLDNENRNWEDRGPGEPRRYYIHGSSICFVPRPSAYYSGNARARLVYTEKPKPLLTGADIPYNDYPYLYPFHYLITYYVTSLCYRDRKMFDVADKYSTMYFQHLELMKKELATNNQPDWKANFTFRNR